MYLKLFFTANHLDLLNHISFTWRLYVPLIQSVMSDRVN